MLGFFISLPFHSNAPLPMTINLIVAMAANRTIGKNNGLPWHLPKDLQFFKTITLGHTVVMGRKTFESIGRPLPKRTNIIITRQPTYTAPEGCLVAHSIQQAIQQAPKNTTELFFIGGGELYLQALPLVQVMYITHLDQPVQGDAYFPPFDPHNWLQTTLYEHPADEQHLYPFSIIRYIRK